MAVKLIGTQDVVQNVAQFLCQLQLQTSSPAVFEMKSYITSAFPAIYNAHSKRGTAK
jgi:hypothetical protein